MILRRLFLQSLLACPFLDHVLDWLNRKTVPQVAMTPLDGDLLEAMKRGDITHYRRLTYPDGRVVEFFCRRHRYRVPVNTVSNEVKLFLPSPHHPLPESRT